MTASAPQIDPLVCYVCERCGRVLETRELGFHDDRHDPERRCEGALGGPFYLVQMDEWLDTLIVAGDR